MRADKFYVTEKNKNCYLTVNTLDIIVMLMDDLIAKNDHYETLNQSSEIYLF
jgi:hypothetical protein